MYEDGGQLLVFVSSRRSAQSEAKKLGQRMEKYLQKNNPEVLPKLRELSQRLARSSNSAMGDTLAECVKGGVAFHHAGLMHAQRAEIKMRSKRDCCIVLVQLLPSQQELISRLDESLLEI